MRINIVVLHGNLADDPYFQHVADGAAYLRFFVVVARERGPSLDHGEKPQRADLIRVIEYGPRAELDYHYLRKGAAVVVKGQLHSRAYLDLRSGVEIRRTQLEVVAQSVAYGRGCDMEQGDRHRTQMIALGDEIDEVVAVPEKAILPEHVLKMLSADAE